jgi:hypothetical protein
VGELCGGARLWLSQHSHDLYSVGGNGTWTRSAFLGFYRASLRFRMALCPTGGECYGSYPGPSTRVEGAQLLLDAVSAPLTHLSRAWLAHSSLGSGGVTLPGTQGATSLWGRALAAIPGPGLTPSPLFLLFSPLPPPPCVPLPHSYTCRPGRPLRGTVTWLPGY